MMNTPTTLNLKRLPIHQLKPAPYNPRIPLTPDSDGWKRLSRSLKEFHLVQPIVWNEVTGHVVSGHQRLEILKSEGIQELDVAVVSLSLEREKALNVTLNNQQVASDWEPEKLLDLLGELQTLPDFDETLTGFNEQDFQDLLLTPFPDFTPESPSETTRQLVTVTLEIPHEQWEEFRPQLDELLVRSNIAAHISLPHSQTN